MTQMRFLFLALLATVAWTGVASGYYFDVWPATADGDMNTYPDEGYAIGGEGNFRFTKTYHHYTYMGFGAWADPVAGEANAGKSDGPDKIPQGRQKGGVNDKNDGVYMADWLVGKKAFAAAIYVRNATAQTCDPYGADGLYWNDPVVVVGFRVGNDGAFVDRGTDALGAVLAGGHGGCCAGYLAPLLDGGENAPGAWRMGKPYVDRAGVLGYSVNGDINEGDPQHQYYTVSYVDTVYAGGTVKVGSAGFGTLGFGGNSTNVPGMSGSSRWAFDYLLFKSDAMMVNSAVINEASCTGYAGEEEPRDFAGDLTFGEGWSAAHVDRCIIQALGGGDPECKGLVFSSRTSAVSPAVNTSVFGRDQGGGGSGAYLAITATVIGDVELDGCCDVLDLLYFVDAFGSAKGDANFNEECDFNCDGFCDVVDLLYFVDGFGTCVP